MLLPLYIAIVKSTKKHRVSWSHSNEKMYRDQYISRKYPNPPAALKQYPVIICVHGFGSSPYEWDEFAAVATDKDCLVSNIFLGNHSNLKDFASSTWKSWLDSIKDEYRRLTKIGYENISICASSTAATLILHALKDNSFLPSLPLRNIIMVDPLLDVNKEMLYKLPYLKNFLFDISVATTLKEKGNWIPKRPVKSLIELLELIKKTKHLLKTKGMIPQHVNVSIFSSEKDPIIKKESAETIVSAFYKNYFKKITHHKIDSSLHVFSRLKGRENIQIKDIENQQLFFEQSLNQIKKNK